MTEKLIKVVYNFVDQNNYQYFLTEEDHIDRPNCSLIVETQPNWVKAIDGDRIIEATNINSKTWRKETHAES